jgi:hypothetical protein
VSVARQPRVCGCVFLCGRGVGCALCGVCGACSGCAVMLAHCAVAAAARNVVHARRTGACVLRWSVRRRVCVVCVCPALLAVIVSQCVQCRAAVLAYVLTNRLTLQCVFVFVRVCVYAWLCPWLCLCHCLCQCVFQCVCACVCGSSSSFFGKGMW